jgi:hypothetical protein
VYQIVATTSTSTYPFKFFSIGSTTKSTTNYATSTEYVFNGDTLLSTVAFAAVGDLEKSISLLIDTGSTVIASESKREQSGIIRRHFRGIRRREQFFEVPCSLPSAKRMFWAGMGTEKYIASPALSPAHVGHGFAWRPFTPS